jgi:hypothetical protein
MTAIKEVSEMTHQVTSLVERLCRVGSPRDVNDWESRDGYYVAACRVSADDVAGLIDVVRKWIDLEWPTIADVPDIDHDDVELLPVTAWRTLADLRADSAVEPLIGMLCELDDEFDDWVSDELPHVFGKIGPSAIEPLMRLAQDERAIEMARSVAVRGLRRVADYHPPTRERIVVWLAEKMAAAREDDVRFNTTVMTELVDLGAVEAAEPIERAFAANLVDTGMFGDWEAVRRILGVAGLGLEMPEKPYNSMDRVRSRVGIGIFSDRAIFRYDEIDNGAEFAYYERAGDVFSKSAEAQRVVERYGDLGWSRMLLEYGLNYLGEVVDTMTLGSVEGFVLGHVPRKVSTQPDQAASIVFELAMFWEYLERVYQLPEANSIVAWLKSEDLVDRLAKELSDPSNFGMAKSFVMAGVEAGYDMTSQSGAAEFMQVYNQSLLAGKAPAPASAPASAPAPILVREQRVGRNDPCPCGSGKKFKKCCR